MSTSLPDFVEVGDNYWYEVAFCLNDAGATLISVANAHLAVEVLREALAAIKIAVRPNDPKEGYTFDYFPRLKHMFSKVNNAMATAVMTDKCDVEDLHIFVLPMKIQQVDEQSCQFCCAAILYNLAVSLHLLGLSERKQHHFHEAMNYYEKALELLFYDDDLTQSSLLIRAVLNNVGLVYRRYGEHELAQEQFETISAISDVCNDQEDSHIFNNLIWNAFETSNKYNISPAA
eukprot:CAMPEP_0183301846 /NCGR_PEP_ID=MMETSP0160_2-20130417/7841_1 /TAXON_ID=2839 ORGANISM="Odontella Sinensis, Strain Grunow 1884" /NCGR_SAMPLE_ID=MMETSP0160_2 /ASSEMBLY_ACC=CAM_ASM_000250 /LENGTH=231 /DNA_ID=CAMNT_0025464539 /DNA_START=1 /DNA_END=696 /DNA_ORIENTATION=-